jgi:hypothetical protein
LPDHVLLKIVWLLMRWIFGPLVLTTRRAAEPESCQGESPW